MATNGCPCGWAGDPSNRCVCAPGDIIRYRARLSGPLADRIDLHVNVAAVPVRSLGVRDRREDSTAVRERVERARATQRCRYSALGGALYNGRVSGRWLDRETNFDGPARELLASAAEQLRLSARSYHRVLRVSRTIADLDGRDAITTAAVAEALRYRPSEKSI